MADAKAEEILSEKVSLLFFSFFFHINANARGTDLILLKSD